MFASWKKARAASLVAAAAATWGMLASPAHALEGVQGKNVIFYPSLELVYQHDDNYYLTPDNDGPLTEEVSADTFIAHAHFAVEVPGARQHLRFEYAPQWRNINVEKGENPDIDEVSHFWNLDAALKGSSVFGVDIHHDFTMGALEGYELDPNVGERIRDNGEGFWANDLGVDFKWEGSKQGAKVMIGKADTSFDDAEEAPAWFELDAWDLGAEYHYRFAPLTYFNAGYRYTDSKQDYTAKAIGFNDYPDSVGAVSNEIWLGARGELGRTTTGAAQVGWTSLNYDEIAGDGADWTGFTLNADVTKSFSRWTKLIFNCQRAPNFSAYSQGLGVLADQSNYYYISNRASFTLTNQPQGARVGWSLIGQFQRNGWDVETPSTSPGAGLNAYEREDDVLRLRAEVGFHPLEHLSFRLNYEWKDNDSNHDESDYTDNLIILQVQFGF